MSEARPIPGMPGYEADDEGRVWSMNWPGRGRYELRRRPDKEGYLRVLLMSDGRSLRFAVHRLVLAAFVGWEPLQVRHLNGNPADNRPSNLRWGTAAENAADRKVHGTEYGGPRHHNTGKDRCPAGHAYTPENTYINRRGSRECRTCKRSRTNKGRR